MKHPQAAPLIEVTLHDIRVYRDRIEGKQRLPTSCSIYGHLLSDLERATVVLIDDDKDEERERIDRQQMEEIYAGLHRFELRLWGVRRRRRPPGPARPQRHKWNGSRCTRPGCHTERWSHCYFINGQGVVFKAPPCPSAPKRQSRRTRS